MGNLNDYFGLKNELDLKCKSGWILIGYDDSNKRLVYENGGDEPNKLMIAIDGYVKTELKKLWM